MTSPVDVVVGIAVEIVIFGIAGGLIYRFWHRATFLPQRVHLMPFNRGVLVRGERLVSILEPGKHWIMPGQSLTPVDIRPKPLQLAPLDLMTQDGRAVRLTLGGEFRVSNPEQYLRESSNSNGAFVLALQQAMPLAVAEFRSTALLADVSAVARRIGERLEPRAAQLGIQVVSLEILSALPLYVQQGYGESNPFAS